MATGEGPPGPPPPTRPSVRLVGGGLPPPLPGSWLPDASLLPSPPADVVKPAKDKAQIPELSPEAIQRLNEIAQTESDPFAQATTYTNLLKYHKGVFEKLRAGGPKYTLVDAVFDTKVDSKADYAKKDGRKAAIAGFQNALRAAGIDPNGKSVPLDKLMTQYLSGLDAARQAGLTQPDQLDEIDPNNPFGFLKDVDAARLVYSIQGEHPQSIALILSHLPKQQAALILTALHPDVQSDVAMRVALMDRTDPRVVQKVAELLRQRIPPESTALQSRGGVSHLVGVLNATDPTSRNIIMNTLDESHPELADEIKKAQFPFERVIQIPTGDMFRIQRELDRHDLLLALRGAKPAVLAAFQRGMSARGWQELQEDIDGLGPQRLSDIETAQQKIIAVMQRLVQADEISEPPPYDEATQQDASVQTGPAENSLAPLTPGEQTDVGLLRQMAAKDHAGRVRELRNSDGTFSQEGAEREISRKEALEQRLIAQRAADPTQRVTQPDDVTQRLGGAWGGVQGAIAQGAEDVTQRIQQDRDQALAQGQNRQPATPIQPPEPVPTHTEVTGQRNWFQTNVLGQDASIIRQVPDQPEGPKFRFTNPQSLLTRGGEIFRQDPTLTSEQIIERVKQEFAAERIPVIQRENPGISDERAFEMFEEQYGRLRSKLQQ